MNKFSVLPCVESGDESYQGHVVPLSSVMDQSIVLFFPVHEDIAKRVNFVIDPTNNPLQDDSEMSVVLTHKMMIESWEVSGRYISGIVMESIPDAESGDDIIDVSLFLSDSIHGGIEGIMKINFVNAIILSVMSGVEIIVVSNLLEKLLPQDGVADVLDDDNNDDNVDIDSEFPVDKDILNTARNILKSNDQNKNNDDNNDDE